DYVNATLHLLANRLGYGAAHAGCQGLVVIGVAALSCPDHLTQVWRTYQAADMGGENTLCAALHSLLLVRSLFSPCTTYFPPQLLSRQPRTLGQRLELGPDNLGRE